MAKTLNLNERSWAIDVISYINEYLSGKEISIKRAGGENTLNDDFNSLFPDVLLFADKNKLDVLQGWELKLPDTSINDIDLISNATKKAELLGLSSFVLWNVNTAILYIKHDAEFEPYKTWALPIQIKNRKEVSSITKEWKSLVEAIVNDLNQFFNSGDIQSRRLISDESLSSIIDIVLLNSASTGDNIAKEKRKNARFRVEAELWWRSAKYEFNEKEEEDLILAKVALTDWVIKILFANIIKRYFDAARQIEVLNYSTSIEEGIAILEGISKSCNFWNIFSKHLAQEYISSTAWNQLMQINAILKESSLESIEVTLLHQLLQSSILRTTRKYAGQFSTPQQLSELLVRLSIEDYEETILDPCCGTGTIIKTAYQLKEKYGVGIDKIIDTIWASDKYAFPLQLATLSLTQPSTFGKILHIFREDATTLTVGKRISFTDPNTGKEHLIPFRKVDTIVSNLPFVQQEDLEHLNPKIYEINDWIIDNVGTDFYLDGKSDLYAYLPFYFYEILNENGKLGIITSNAWLGTKYGELFLETLKECYQINNIVVSGKGRWFKNADVVTCILVLTKKNIGEHKNVNIQFSVLKENIIDSIEVESIANDIILSKNTGKVSVQLYSSEQISHLGQLNIPWSSYFTDLTWLFKVENKLSSILDYFDIGRGERRGWNALFYPAKGHGIEKPYLQPVLKDLKKTKGLIAQPNKIAFCCSKSLKELKELGHTGAINWIKSFEKLNNKSNRPLTESLKRSGHYWYEMKTNTMADFAANVNYDKSLFVAKLEKQSFVDQRVIPLRLKGKIQNNHSDLLFALMNTTLSMLFIEALGFGRGLGALDLNATKFKLGFKILNPALLSEESGNKIIEAFEPLLNRDRLALEQELKANDRLQFDKCVLKEFGILEYYDPIKKSLLELYNIRMAVKS